MTTSQDCCRARCSHLACPQTRGRPLLPSPSSRAPRIIRLFKNGEERASGPNARLRIIVSRVSMHGSEKTSADRCSPLLTVADGRGSCGPAKATAPRQGRQRVAADRARGSERVQRDQNRRMSTAHPERRSTGLVARGRQAAEPLSLIARDRKPAACPPGFNGR
jgi:hypothetical protein